MNAIEEKQILVYSFARFTVCDIFLKLNLILNKIAIEIITNSNSKQIKFEHNFSILVNNYYSLLKILQFQNFIFSMLKT